MEGQATIRRMAAICAVLISVFAPSICKANTCTIGWEVHDNTTIADAIIQGWHTLSTTRLCTDDDGAGTDDRSVLTTLTCGTITQDWTYPDSDEDPDIITSAAERDKAYAGMSKWGAVITEFNINGGEWAWGKTGTKQLIIAKSVPSVGNTPGVVLAHEVGHNANIANHNAGEDFIMNATIGGAEKYVSADEKTKYEAL